MGRRYGFLALTASAAFALAACTALSGVDDLTVVDKDGGGLSAGKGGTGGGTDAHADTGGTGGAAGNAGTGGAAGSSGAGGAHNDASADVAGTGGGAPDSGSDAVVQGDTGDGAATDGNPDACPGTAGPTMVRVHPSSGPTFCIDSTEVSNNQYKLFLAAKQVDAGVYDTSGQTSVCSWNKEYRPEDQNPDDDGGIVATLDWPPPTDQGNFPVHNVDWCDAYAYCSWAGKRLCGKIGGGPVDYADLNDPTKDQWYNACSNDGPNPFPYGGTFNEMACNGYDKDPTGCYVDNGTKYGDCILVDVGSLPLCQGVGDYAGIYDQSGNVFEWEDSCTTDPMTHKDYCHIRGGAIFGDGDYDLHCNYDDTNDYPDLRSDTAYGIGFRCCGP